MRNNPVARSLGRVLRDVGVRAGSRLLLLAPLSGLAQGPSEVQVHGFVSQGAIKTTDNNYLADSERGSVEFTEVGINFTNALTDRLRLGIQLFAYDLGPLGNYDARFDWFYLDYRAWDWLGFRAGRTKLPFGLYNETSDIDAARVPILLPQSMYPVTNRDALLAQTGGELYGYVPLGPVGELEYRLYGGTIFLDLGESSLVDGEVSVPYLIGGRLMWLLPWEGLQLGGSLQAVRFDFTYIPPPGLLQPAQEAGLVPADFDGTVDVRVPFLLAVASLEYNAHDLLVAAEYSRWHAELESELPTLIQPMTITSERAYVMTSYRIAPWFVPGVYYSLTYPNVKTRSGHQNYQHDVALTLRYDLTQHWLLKLEGHYMHGTAALASEMNDGVPPAELTRDWGLFLAKTTAYF